MQVLSVPPTWLLRQHNIMSAKFSSKEENLSNSPTLFSIAKQLRLKKRFSQNFLVNPAVLDQITKLLTIEETDVVLEIGPGAGFLTRQLLEDAPKKLYAVELDRKMCQYLEEQFPESAHPTFQLIAQDILRFDLTTLNEPKLKIVGNLPYNITSKILFKLVGELSQVVYPERKLITQLTIMVQKEVAERIAAKPGQKAYNALSIALQIWFDVTLNMVIPARSFYPEPKVQSAVITLMPRQTPRIAEEQMIGLSKLVRAAFSQKRKTLRNALKGSGFASLEQIDAAMATVGINANLRAEALSIEEFGKLVNAFSQNAC